MSRFALVLVAVLLLAVGVQAGFYEDEMSRVRKYNAENFMARMAKRPEVSVLPSGILVHIMKRGFGDVAPAEKDKCEMHYTTLYRFNAEQFTSRHNPYPVRRSPSQMVPGVKEAMQLMREGDRWFIYVPYQLAYGAAGNPSVNVSAFASLRYDVELYKCPGASGKTSAEIDAYLAKYLKSPMPPKTPEINYEDL